MRALRSLALAGATLLGSTALANSVVIIKNSDKPNVGFNDPTPATPVGNNPGTTVGEQRLWDFEFAAAVWGATLKTSVPITVDASFAPLDCDAQSAVLGAAAPTTAESGFNGAVLPGYLYAVTTANALSGTDLNGSGPEISANFNYNLGQANCLAGSGWYYGLDGQPPPANPDGTQLIPLATVLEHEFGHGMGFLTFENGQSGANLNGKPDVFEHFLFDDTAQLAWDQMSSTQRAASALNPEHVGWTGSNVDALIPQILQKNIVFSATAPAGLVGDYPYGYAEFGPLPDGGLSGTLTMAQDAVDGDAYGCGQMKPVTGKLAYVLRGPPDAGCPFVVKAANAQDAGAIAMVVGDYDPADTTIKLTMAGQDPSIHIPSVILTTPDSSKFTAALSSGDATVAFHAGTAHQGTDATDQRLLVFTPSQFQVGSSVSHWTMAASPALLMQPYFSDSMPQGLDFTYPFMQDIGWQTEGPVALGMSKFGLPSVNPGGKAQYVIVVVNHSTSPISNVVVDATGPTGLTFESNFGSCSTAFPCTIASVPADSVAPIVTTYSVPDNYTASGNVAETATLSYTGSSPGDPSLAAQWTSAVQPASDMSISATGPTTVKDGDTLTLDATITNGGPSVAGATTVTAPTNPGVTLKSFGGDCSGTTCALGDLPVGATKHVTATFTVKANGLGNVVPQLNVGSNSVDPVASNDIATVSVTVQGSVGGGGGCTAPGTAAGFPLALLAIAVLLRRARG